MIVSLVILLTLGLAGHCFATEEAPEPALIEGEVFDPAVTEGEAFEPALIEGGPESPRTGEEEEPQPLIADPPLDESHGPRNRGVCSKDAKADVYLLLDISTSIGKALWQEEAKFAEAVMEDLSAEPNGLLFGALIFNSSPLLIFTLDKYASSLSKLLKIQYPNIQGTNTSLALLTIRNRGLFSTQGGRPDARDSLVVVTDGFSDNPDETKKQAQLLKDKDVTVFVVGLGASNAQELAALASRPEYILKAKTADQLENVIKDLVKLICQAGL